MAQPQLEKKGRRKLVFSASKDISNGAGGRWECIDADGNVWTVNSEFYPAPDKEWEFETALYGVKNIAFSDEMFAKLAGSSAASKELPPLGLQTVVIVKQEFY